MIPPPPLKLHKNNNQNCYIKISDKLKTVQQEYREQILNNNNFMIINPTFNEWVALNNIKI